MGEAAARGRKSIGAKRNPESADAIVEAAEAVLREADASKNRFLAVLAHELRTPLAAIKGHASSLLQEDVVWSPDEQRQFVSEISDESDRLAQLVSNLLDLSRIESGLLQLARMPCRVAQLVTRVIRRLPEPIADLSVAISPNLPLLEVDEPRIEVVLHNLLSNAQAYGDGAIRVTAEQDRSAIVVRVSDNGPGIAPEELPHLFERFYRGDAATAPGSGLGLAIASELADRMGGSIELDSRPGETVFTLLLPRADAVFTSKRPNGGS